MRKLNIRRTTIAATVALAVAGGVLTTNILGASASDNQAENAKKKRKGFTPKVLAGTYNGTWTNTTFGSTGALTLVVKAPRSGKLSLYLDFAGDVFGCPDPAADSALLKAGNGVNRWNGKGFKIDRTSPSLGKGTLNYVYKTKALTGGGADPTCKTGLKWALSATTLTKTALNGTIDITLPDGSKAVATLAATKA